MVPVPGTKYYWITNKWYPKERINIEEGPLVSSEIADNAWSAQWELMGSNMGTGTFYIVNRWYPGRKINIEKGQLECTAIPFAANSAIWYLRMVE